MGTFLAYNLKLSICFLLFYLLYRVLLCKNTFHRTNRLVLLSTYIFILFVPLIPLAITRPYEIHGIISDYEWLLLQSFYAPTETVLTQPAFRWTHIVVVIYLLGVLFFACRYLYFLTQIIFRIKTGKKIQLDNNITLVISEKNTTPFSWMRYIVLPKTDEAENHHAILSHEQAHIKHRHSIDLLIADLSAIVQWYNPAIWLMKNELQDVHEYEADEDTLHSGIDVKQYQLLLIKEAVGSQRFNSMTNSFNHSKLKKRITMMMRKKNSHWVRLKYVSILPLAALAVTLFARPEVSNKLDEISAVKVSDFTSVNEVNVESFREENVKETTKPKAVQQQIAVTTEANNTIRGRVIDESDSPIVGAEPLYFVDDVEVSDISSVNIDDVYAVSVLKDSAATAAFGPRGADGVVLVTTKKAKINTEPLYVVDGVIVSNPFGKETLNLFGTKTDSKDKLDVDNIESINVLKGVSATSIYGEKGVNGVIIITTKKRLLGK